MRGRAMRDACWQAKECYGRETTARWARAMFLRLSSSSSLHFRANPGPNPVPSPVPERPPSTGPTPQSPLPQRGPPWLNFAGRLHRVHDDKAAVLQAATRRHATALQPSALNLDMHTMATGSGTPGPPPPPPGQATQKVSDVLTAFRPAKVRVATPVQGLGAGR